MTAHYRCWFGFVIKEVITFIYCRLSRPGDTHKHTVTANVLRFTDRDACVTTSFIDFVMSQRVFITRVRGCMIICVSEREGMHVSLVRGTVTLFRLSVSWDGGAKMV